MKLLAKIVIDEICDIWIKSLYTHFLSKCYLLTTHVMEHKLPFMIGLMNIRKIMSASGVWYWIVGVIKL